MTRRPIYRRSDPRYLRRLRFKRMLWNIRYMVEDSAEHISAGLGVLALFAIFAATLLLFN